MYSRDDWSLYISYKSGEGYGNFITHKFVLKMSFFSNYDYCSTNIVKGTVSATTNVKFPTISHPFYYRCLYKYTIIVNYINRNFFVQVQVKKIFDN